MQINYDFYNDRRAYSAGFWNTPDLNNSLRASNIPVLYAPYGTPGWWRDGSTPPSLQGLGDVGSGMTPNTLVAVMPSITPTRTPQATPSDSSCNISQWVQNNTSLAVLAAVAVFAVARGGK